MTRLILITHAETPATLRAAFAADEASTPKGLEAARRAAAIHAGIRLCSPARAASETAGAMGLAATTEPALGDLDAGRWAGLAFADIAAAEPNAAAAFLVDPAYAGHGGEAIEDLVARVAALLDRLRGARGRIVAVTHAAVVRAAVIAALRVPASAFFQIDAPPLSHVVLGSDGRRWALRAQALPIPSEPVT